MAFTEEIILKAKDEASKSIGNVNLSMETLKKTTVAAGAVFTAGAFLISDWTKEAINAEMIYKSLESGLKRNIEETKTLNVLGSEATTISIDSANAIKKQTEELKQLAFGLQDASVFSGDNIVQAQALLSNYQLTTEQIKSMTPVVVDFASKISMMTGKQADVVEATSLIGRALQGNAIGLKKYGINLTENGKALTDYDNVLRIVRENTRGAAEDYSKTTVGALAQLKNSYDDLKRDLGMSFLPVLQDIVSLGLKPIIDFMNSLSSDNKKLIASIILGTTAISGIVLALGTLSIAITAINIPLAIMALKIAAIATAVLGLVALFKELGSVAGDFVGGFGIESVELSDVAKQKQRDLGLASYETGNANIDNEYARQRQKPKIYNGIKDFFSGVEEENMNNPLLEAGILG